MLAGSGGAEPAGAADTVAPASEAVGPGPMVGGPRVDHESSLLIIWTAGNRRLKREYGLPWTGVNLIYFCHCGCSRLRPREAQDHRLSCGAWRKGDHHADTRRIEGRH